MKTIAAVLLFLPSLSLAQTDAAASVAGTWKVHLSVAGNDSDAECTFAQKDTEITGTCVTDTNTEPVTGKVDGQKITWSYPSEYEGTKLTISYAGKLNADKITGEANVDPYGVSGDFTATASKPQP